jgi:flagellar protein FlgJ
MEAISADMIRLNATMVYPEISRGDDDARLRAAATEFEVLFAKQMLNTMRATLNTENDMLHGGLAQEFFEDMLYEEYARMMAKTGDLGIADIIYNQYSSAI